LSKPLSSASASVALLAMLSGAPLGCQDGKFGLKVPWDSPADHKPEPAETPVPEPLHLLLPRSIRIQPFTGVRTFDKAGGVKGIEARVEALDAYGDATKAFGKFHFALHGYRPDKADPKGPRIATWDEDLLDPKKNLLHWSRVHRSYQFHLQWDSPIPVGSQFLLVATFSSPFGERKFAEQVFVSGQ